MAAADKKTTYTAAEVAKLIRPLTQSVEALQKENTELKQKLEHMNEILANAQSPIRPVQREEELYWLFLWIPPVFRFHRCTRHGRISQANPVRMPTSLC